MKGLFAIAAVLLVAVMISPAYAVIVEFQTEKTSYKKGDIIQFTGRTDADHANKMVSIKIYGPSGGFVMLYGGLTDSDSILQVNGIDTTKYSDKFSQKGIYNATAFYDDEPTYLGKSTIFDFSPDGSPVSPSAAEIMGQPESQPAQEEQSAVESTQHNAASEQEQTTTEPEQTQQTETTEQQTTQEPPAQTTASQCGAGTVLNSEGQCVVATQQQTQGQTQQQQTTTKIPGFPDPTKTSEYYIDRYNNEPEFKAWFDKNFPDQTIYDVLGVPGPKTTKIPGFPDPDKDPQYYIDRYNNEPEYKAWFDRNFPGQTIYEVVGATPPEEEVPTGCGKGTHAENGVCVLDKTAKKQSPLSGCLIATATYGTEMAPQVQELRELRQNTLLATQSGATFMGAFNDLYYSFSPTVADWERQSPLFKESVKIAITPMISSLSLLNFVDVDSDQKVLGYGIGVILLNIGMYFVAPALVMMKIRSFLKKP